jgi:hypothetical protein
LYRLLVRLYPAAHRRAFGEQMVQTFGDHYRDVVVSRGGSRLKFWLAVLADAGPSLLTEHAAERRTRCRRRAATAYRRLLTRRGRPTRGRRVRRPLRYRPRSGRRRHQLVFRGLIALVAVGLGTGTATGHLGLSVLVAGLAMVAWLGYGFRLTRRVPAGPHGDGPAPPGGAGVREPRRPLPMSPAGSAARPLPDQDPRGSAAALI